MSVAFISHHQRKFFNAEKRGLWRHQRKHGVTWLSAGGVTLIGVSGNRRNVAGQCGVSCRLANGLSISWTLKIRQAVMKYQRRKGNGGMVSMAYQLMK
jgi:hypothetical protein